MFQDSSLDFKLVQRVCLLQQALDQATESLEEMQQQVANHQMLQSHLAQTEEYSNVQQKIIVNLKQQLNAKQHWQQQLLSNLLTDLRQLIDIQQVELERLRLRIHQSYTEVQDYLVRLKNHYQSPSLPAEPAQPHDLNSEVMIVRALTVSLGHQLQAAQDHIQHLDHILTRYQVTFARFQVYSKALDTPTSAPSGVEPRAANPNQASEEDAIALRAVVTAHQQKIDQLTGALNSQFHQQTFLRSRCQEIAAERDSLKQREKALQLENERLRAALAATQAPIANPRTIHAWQAPSQEPSPLSRWLSQA
jgi:DNA repair exonuclease SbcCD ATPase subunit